MAWEGTGPLSLAFGVTTYAYSQVTTSNDQWVSSLAFAGAFAGVGTTAIYLLRYDITAN